MKGLRLHSAWPTLVRDLPRPEVRPESSHQIGLALGMDHLASLGHRTEIALLVSAPGGFGERAGTASPPSNLCLPHLRRGAAHATSITREWTSGRIPAPPRWAPWLPSGMRIRAPPRYLPSPIPAPSRPCSGCNKGRSACPRRFPSSASMDPNSERESTRSSPRSQTRSRRRPTRFSRFWTTGPRAFGKFSCLHPVGAGQRHRGQSDLPDHVFPLAFEPVVARHACRRAPGFAARLHPGRDAGRPGHHGDYSGAGCARSAFIFRPNQLNADVATLSGILDQAREAATSGNSFVWVAFADPPAADKANGLWVATIETQDGTGSPINTTVMPAWLTSVTIPGPNLAMEMKIDRLPGVQLVDAAAGALPSGLLSKAPTSATPLFEPQQMEWTITSLQKHPPGRRSFLQPRDRVRAQWRSACLHLEQQYPVRPGSRRRRGHQLGVVQHLPADGKTDGLPPLIVGRGAKSLPAASP